MFILADINLSDPAWQFWIGLGSLILSAVAIAITIFVTLRARQRKLLTYELVSDSSVVNFQNDVGDPVKIVLGHRDQTGTIQWREDLDKVRLHIIKVLNAGNVPLEESDYAAPLKFDFTAPEFQEGKYQAPLILCSIHQVDPPHTYELAELRQQERLKLNENDPERKSMLLRPPLLNPGVAIFLKVLLKADHLGSVKVAVTNRGVMKGGTISEYRPPRTQVNWRLVVTGVLLAFILGLLVSNSIGLITAFTQNTCAVGSIQDGGSTSFYNAALAQQQQYNLTCPSQLAHIAVSSNSSGEGIAQLIRGTLQIANSEITPLQANHPQTDLVDHQVAVIVFALVVNKSLKISSLSTTQLQKIYDGSYTSWKQVDPQAPDIPITLFGRQGSSGTQASFFSFVLKRPPSSGDARMIAEGSSVDVVGAVAGSPGGLGYADYGDAINNSSVNILEIDQVAPAPALVANGSYPFWAIEHMYTRSNPDALALSFIAYVKKNLHIAGSFIDLNSMNPTVLKSHT